MCCTATRIGFRPSLSSESVGLTGVGGASPAIDSASTLLVRRSTLRIWWLLVSATYRLSPATERPAGSENRGGSRRSPDWPSPRNVTAEFSLGSTRLILWL